MRKVFAVVLASLALSLGAAGSAGAAPIEIGHIPECTEAVPAAVSTTGPETTLSVRVLVDGVGSDRVSQAVAATKASYTGVGANVVASFQGVSFNGTDAQGLIDQAKAAMGGRRPAGVDLVYVITDKDIELDGNTAVAGLADCIGGVAFADRAFAVGEAFTPDESLVIGPTALARNLTAKVMAHELGHLMGGHHHYANCVEGLATETPSELSPCTLMFNAVDASSLNFSALNKLVVRGHAEAYAAP